MFNGNEHTYRGCSRYSSFLHFPLFIWLFLYKESMFFYPFNFCIQVRISFLSILHIAFIKAQNTDFPISQVSNIRWSLLIVELFYGFWITAFGEQITNMIWIPNGNLCFVIDIVQWRQAKKVIDSKNFNQTRLQFHQKFV